MNRPITPPDGSAGAPMEVWGGIECSVVRIGDRYRNQIAETGHDRRLCDLDRIRDLGITRVRYPVLWELVAPNRPDRFDWRWTDERLHRLRELGIRPIATFLHHGSGPRYTSLLDPDFPKKLADYAAAVADRYPWIEDFTPVNEPLTTARFSGLYGHWYPHGTDYQTFLRAFMNQCLGIASAMTAIRAVSPAARLVQTEDLGKTFATRRLAYQAEHENSRRWLTFDLLCGKIDPNHPWWSLLRHFGARDSELATFIGGAFAPDVLGLDHYLTSERYLDEAHDRYPPCFRGGNGRHDYADVEAVRMPIRDVGPRARFLEVWNRYRRPMALTEVHHGAEPENQLRWLMTVWTAAQQARAAGADLRAATVWALVGMVDWRSLLCRDEQCYEPGAFDVRGAVPAPTLLAEATQALALTGRFDHPILGEPGWWARPDRFYRPTALRAGPRRSRRQPDDRPSIPA